MSARASRESARATGVNPEMHLDPKYDDYDYPTTAPEQQSGHPGHTSKEQDAQVQQLRMMLEQEGHKDRLDTLTLLRFLRARKFNVQLAHDMYETTSTNKRAALLTLLQVRCQREMAKGVRHRRARPHL